MTSRQTLPGPPRPPWLWARGWRWRRAAAAQLQQTGNLQEPLTRSPPLGSHALASEPTVPVRPRLAARAGGGIARRVGGRIGGWVLGSGRRRRSRGRSPARAAPRLLYSPCLIRRLQNILGGGEDAADKPSDWAISPSDGQTVRSGAAPRWWPMRGGGAPASVPGVKLIWHKQCPIPDADLLKSSSQEAKDTKSRPS